MGRATHVNQSGQRDEACHAFEWVVSRMGCVTRIQNVHLSESKRVVCWNASWRTYKWVTNFICKSATNSSQRNESKRVVSCIGMRHDVSHEWVVTQEWGMSHIWMSHVAHTGAFDWRGREAWYHRFGGKRRGASQSERRGRGWAQTGDASIRIETQFDVFAGRAVKRGEWRIYMLKGVTHICMWHDSSHRRVNTQMTVFAVHVVECGKWRIYMLKGVTHTYMWHVSFHHRVNTQMTVFAVHAVECDEWRIYMLQGVTHTRMWRDWFYCRVNTRMNVFAVHAIECGEWRIYMKGVTHTYMWHDSFHRRVNTQMNVFAVRAFECGEWRIHIVRDVTRANMWHDSFYGRMKRQMTVFAVRAVEYDQWRIHILWDVARAYMWHDSFYSRIKRQIDVFCADAPSSVVSDAVICWETWLIHICDVTHLV